MYSQSEKNKQTNKQKTLLFISIQIVYTYRTEMKLEPLIINYCLLQFNALKFSLGVRLSGGSLPNFKFLQYEPRFFNKIIKFTS